GDALRHLGIMIELHRVDGAALREGAQICRVAEHLGERHGCSNDLCILALPHTLDPSTAAVQVADDVTHVLLGRDDLDLHDGFHDDRIGAPGCLAESHAAGDLEGVLVGVDVVKLAVVQPCAHAFYRITG